MNVPEWAVTAMKSHARHASPQEACGALVGQDGVVTRVKPIRNVATERHQFRLSPAGQLEVWREAFELGEQLLAVYHSHPTIPATPTDTDTAGAHGYPHLCHVIVSIAWDEVRAYRLTEGALVEEPLRVLA